MLLYQWCSLKRLRNTSCQVNNGVESGMLMLMIVAFPIYVTVWIIIKDNYLYYNYAFATIIKLMCYVV